MSRCRPLPDLGRTGRKVAAHTGLPPQTPLPSLTSALSRRAALFGAVTVAGVSAAVVLPTVAQAGALSVNDARLIAIADAYLDLDRRCHEHTAAHHGCHTPESDADFDLMVEGFGPLEEECAATPADSLAGVVAKAKLCRNPT